MALKVLEFAFVIYPSTDLQRSRTFFEGVLGLEPSMLFQEGDQFYIEYEIGPHTLGVGNEPFLKPGGDGPHVVMEVEDFDEAVAHLRERNVPFAIELLDMPACRAAMILDPDGNKVGIHQRKTDAGN